VAQFFALLSVAPPATFRIVMPESPLTPPPEVLPAGSIGAPAVARPTPEGEAALAMAAGLARRAAASATLRAYKADWQHYAAWCARTGFVPVPAEPATVGAYREHGRPAQKAAALTLAMLRRLVATCDTSARGRRDRALLLIGFAGALRRSELVALRVEDVSVVAGGLRLRIARSKTDPAGAGAEIGLPRGKHPDTCPVQAFKAWQAVAKRKSGPLFRRISTAGTIGGAALHPDAVRRILAHRMCLAGLEGEGSERLSAHALRVGFITEAYGKGVRDEDIMRHTRHRDLRTMRGYVQRAGLITDSPAGTLDL
jgi:integrase